MNQVFPKLVWETIIRYLPAKTKSLYYHDNNPDNIIRQIIIEQSKMPPESLRFWVNVISVSSEVPFPAVENDPFMIKLFKDYIWIFVNQNEVVIKEQKTRNKIFFTDLINVYDICDNQVKRYLKHKHKYSHSFHNRYSNNLINFFHHGAKVNNMQFCELALIKYDHPFHDQISIECITSNTRTMSIYSRNNYPSGSHQYMINSPRFLRCYVPYSMLTDNPYSMLTNNYTSFKVSDMTFLDGKFPADFYGNAFFVYKTKQYSKTIKPWQKIIFDPKRQLAFILDINENLNNFPTLFQQKLNELQAIFDKNIKEEKELRKQAEERLERYKKDPMLNEQTLDSLRYNHRLEVYRHDIEAKKQSDLIERARLDWAPDIPEYTMYQSIITGVKELPKKSSQMDTEDHITNLYLKEKDKVRFGTERGRSVRKI